jgi:archaeal flagellin FlaB
MKANHTARYKQDTRAQVGIGTMIVFIATILVAATAAALLIDTSGRLQERSAQTGQDATAEVASNLIVRSAYGERDDTASNISTLKLTVALAPGATPVDLSQMVVMYNDASGQTQYDYGTEASTSAFNASAVRDPGSGFDNDNAVMFAGSLVTIEFEIDDEDGLGPRSPASVTLFPEVGSPVHYGFTTPASYGSSLSISLR